MAEFGNDGRRSFLVALLVPLSAILTVDLHGAVREQRASASSSRRTRARRRGRQVGLATFYSREFTGDKTASGSRYDPNALTAAHRTWPFGTVVRVTELETGRSVLVTITDRGPFGRNRRKGAVIDLSRAAARQLNMLEDGVIRVRLDVMRWGTTASARRP
jgi:rare lipoprotein A